jgi:hypothetical protein
MKSFQTASRLLGFAVAIGIAVGTPTPIWAARGVGDPLGAPRFGHAPRRPCGYPILSPSPRLVIRSGTEPIYEGAAVLTHSDSGTMVQANPGRMIPGVRFSEDLPRLKERAVISSTLQLKDRTLAGLATVHAKVLGTTRDGGQIIRYDIRGGYGEASCHASVEVSLVRIYYWIP